MELLAYRTWRDIRLVALAHNFRFDTNQTKREGLKTVLTVLLPDGGLRRSYRQLAASEREPLIALQLSGGVLGLYEFTANFGQIRRYKPWRNDDSRFFWKRPISPAEKLWHLGMVEIQRGKRGQVDAVHLPDEVAVLLPPLPRPAAAVIGSLAAQEQEEGSRSTFLRDLAALLSGLLAGEGHWIRQRWLSIRSLRKLNFRLLHQDNLATIRSERKAGRIRFLHYVLHVAGLIAEGQPTPTAWHWLSAPDKWDVLWNAVRDDLAARDRLWSRYGLPGVDVRAWDKLTALLCDLVPGRIYDRDSIYAMLRFDLDPVMFNTLLDTVLTWGSWVRVADNSLSILSPEFYDEPARLSQHGNVFYLDIPPAPALRPFVEISHWAQVESAYCLQLDRDAVRRAIQQGYNAVAISRLLAELTGTCVSQDTAQLIRRWAQSAQAITLRTLTVLTVVDAETTKQIRSDWRLRPLLGESLSPHHLVVQTDQAERLCKKLKQRGYPVMSQIASTAPERVSAPADYLYLAVSVYRQLSQLVSTEVNLPGEVVQIAALELSSERITALDQTAIQMVGNVQRSLMGIQAARGGVAPDDPDSITEAVENACREHQTIRIRYYSPYTGEETTRTIEPIMLYERNGARYVEAWCQLDDDTRTFRLDRILQILS